MLAVTRLVSFLLLPLFLSLSRIPQPPPAAKAAAPADTARARYLITVADDFVVDIYHNGKAVPETKRTLLEERFGATVERIDIEVKRGDWLVFNVANNRMRWGGAYYFAVAGCFAPNEFGFVSSLEDGRWSVCDTPGDVDKFITQKTYFENHPAQKIAQPWSDGTPLMQQYAGGNWNGSPVWGSSRNTYVKVLVE